MSFPKLFILFLMSLSITKCSSSDSSSGTNSSVTGTLVSVAISSVSKMNGLQIRSTKNITHVMAVSPATSNTERYIAAVNSDGTFNLPVNSGKPYIIVFISQDGVLTGPDMIVGTIKVSANDLDTLPIAQQATVDLGSISIDGSNGQASPSTSVNDLLSGLGITSAAANYIGAIDDLALRLANPDVDMNGVIDSFESKKFSMDWHVRADTLKADTSLLRLSDVENTFADVADVVISWNLVSAYAVYPTSYDNTNYVGNSGVDTSTINNGAFSYAGTAIAPTSLSENTSGGSYHQWGPDYNVASAEMGASDAVSIFTYTLSGGRTLKYSNVKTKTKSQLNADGVMLPFIKINTANGFLTGISYKWMKRYGSTWVDATAAEISLLVQDSGAYLTLYTLRSSGVEKGISFTIPTSSATGSISVGSAHNSGITDVNSVALTDICMTAMSYDDKMGLRLFAGAPRENSGVTSCP